MAIALKEIVLEFKPLSDEHVDEGVLPDEDDGDLDDEEDEDDEDDLGDDEEKKKDDGEASDDGMPQE